jgi:hypothetical protein
MKHILNTYTSFPAYSVFLPYCACLVRAGHPIDIRNGSHECPAKSGEGPLKPRHGDALRGGRKELRARETSQPDVVTLETQPHAS